VNGKHIFDPEGSGRALLPYIVPE